MKGLAHPICDDYLAACEALGLPHTPDFNGAQFEGAGIYETNIRRGQRSSSGAEYLTPARKRDKLTVMTHTQALRLLFADGASPQVTGVRVCHKDHEFNVHARKEVIVAAGAVGSPQLLQCSGIGEEQALRRLGIQVKHHLPQVGKNLQDHLCASFYYRATRPTLNDEFNSLWGQMRAGLQYLLTRQGPLSLSVNQAGGFFKGSAQEAQANLQLYFNPLSYTIPPNPKASLKPEPYSGFLMAFNACRPTSTGEVRIDASDARQAPAIDPNYLSTARDQEEVLQAVRLIRRLTDTAPLRALMEAEVTPGVDIQSDAQMLQYYKDNCGSIYHLCGTCAMGSDAQTSVVDAQLRVHGVQGLRVIDASVFPNITSGNINAPTMMVAEKGADLHLGNQDLPAGDVLVQVDYSSLNYKDAMAVTGTGKIVRQFPMVPGIDLAGTVLESTSPEYQAGDRVILTGWSVGERFWGGYSQRQRVKAEWLTPMPEGMDSLTAMTLGTAGLTAMLCVMALQD
eukprot:gene14290-14083_t